MRFLVACIAAAIAVHLTGCGFDLASLEDYPNSESVYLGTFNTPVPPTVTNLTASGSAFRDSSTCYLKFDATLATVNSITLNSFTPTSAATFNSEANGSAEARWWKPTDTPTTTYYASTTFHPTFSSGNAYMSHDTATNTTYLYWFGWD